MPVYNSEPARFQQSLQALLDQSYGDFELIISDNGSHEEARALYERAAASDARIRYVRHAHNYGAALNFNYSFSLARGEYFMWSADDDIREREYLRRTVDLLDENPAAASAGTGVVLVDNEDNPAGQVEFYRSFALPLAVQRIPVRDRLRFGDYMDVYSLHRRAALAHTHLTLPIHGSDVLLVRELLLQGPIVRAQEKLFRYRLPTKYDMDSLSAAILGSQARPLPFRFPMQHLALHMLLVVATTNVPISEAERAACVAGLGLSLVRHGWLTREILTATKGRLRILLQRLSRSEAHAALSRVETTSRA